MGFSGSAFVGFKLVERQPAGTEADSPGGEPTGADQEPINPQVFKVISDLHMAGAGNAPPAGEGPAA